MPRLSKQTPKYRKHKASGQAFIELNGKRHYLGPHGSKASIREYDRVLAEWLAAGRSPSYGKPDAPLTVALVVRDYLAHAKKYYGDAERGSYRNILLGMRPLKELYGRSPAAEFGVLQFKAIREQFIAQDLSRPYINERMRMIVAVFRWACGEGLVPGAVVQNLDAIPGLRKGRCGIREPDPIKPVDEETVLATLPHLSSVVEAMVRFQQLTGCRPGEVCGLRPRDIDRSNAVWEAKLTEHKTAWHGLDRTIYIGPQAQIVLTPYLLRGADDYCFSPAEAMQEMRDRRNAARKTPLSCGNRRGTNKLKKPTRVPDAKYTTQSYSRAISRACELTFPHETLGGRDPKKLSAKDRTELREWNKAHRWAPNQLRHALATKVRREFDIDAAKTLLGHQSIGITEIYAEKDHSRAIQVAAKIG
jgi:integrase